MKQYRVKIRWKKVPLICLIVFVFLATPTWGQPIKQVTINYIEAETVPAQFSNEVRAFVTVSDADEKPVLGLPGENFQVLEDGKKVDAEEVTPAVDPMAIVLAIDTSGSMQAQDTSGQTSMTAAKRAALDFVSMLSEKDKVALFSFNNESMLQVDFSDDHGAVINAIYALAAKPNAATCLYDTAFEAVKKAAEIPKGRRAVILLTDGKDEKAGQTCSTHNVNDVIDTATTKTIRVPIYTIGVGPKVDARELGRIASLTGGRNLQASTLAELQMFYQTIADQLKNQYFIKYVTRIPSGEHSLIVKVQTGESKGQDEKRFWTPPLPVSLPPAVSIVRPGSEDEIQGAVNVTAKISPEDTLVKARFYVDGVLKAENENSPFGMFEWDTAGLSPGLHVIRIEAVDMNGQTGYAEITKNIPSPAGAAEGTPAQTGKEGKEGASGMIWTVGILLFLAVLAGGAVFLLRKQKKEPADVPVAEVEDETVFIPEAGNGKPHPPAWLKVVKSQKLKPGKTFQISGSATVGRSSENQIHIPDKPISRRHAEFYFENDVCCVRDLGSKNGVRVDGRRIPVDGIPLVNGQQIQLSPETILEFHILDFGTDTSADEKTRKYDH